MSDAVDTHALAVELAELLGSNASTSSLLTAEQAAELLNVPESWVRSETRANRLPHVEIGRYRRYRREDLITWVDGRSRGRR